LNLRRRLRPKIWPKKGQNVSKSKKFKILNEDKKDYNKITTLQKQTKNYFVRLFVVFFGLDNTQKPKNCGYSNASCAVQGIFSPKICVICFTRCLKTKSYFCEKHHIFETFSLLLLVLVWNNKYIFDKKTIKA